MPAKIRPHIQPLHLANARLQWTQCNTAHPIAFFTRKQESSCRSCVLPRQRCEFLIERLEAQAETERRSVLEEEFARDSNVCGRLGLEDLNHCLERLFAVGHRATATG